MAKPVQIAVKHGGSDPWILSCVFNAWFCCCSRGTQPLCIPNGSQFIIFYAAFVWRLNGSPIVDGPEVPELQRHCPVTGVRLGGVRGQDGVI